MNVKEFFDAYWSARRFRGFDDLRKVLSFPSTYARSLAGDLRGKRILEIGPGMGDDLFGFVRSGGEVSGIEISDEALAILRRSINKDRISLCKMDACNLGFRAGVFDLIFLKACLMHLDRRRLFPGIRRVLKQGGRVLAVEPLKQNPLLFLYRSLCSPGRRISPSYFGLGEIKDLRRSFERVNHREFYLISPFLLGISAIFPPFRRLIPLTELLDGLLLEVFPVLRKLSWMAVVECLKE